MAETEGAPRPVHEIKIDPDASIDDNLTNTVEGISEHGEGFVLFDKKASEDLIKNVVIQTGSSDGGLVGGQVKEINDVEVNFEGRIADVKVKGTGRAKILGFEKDVGISADVKLEMTESGSLTADIVRTSRGIRGLIESRIGGEKINTEAAKYLRDRFEEREVAIEDPEWDITERGLKVTLKKAPESVEGVRSKTTEPPELTGYVTEEQSEAEGKISLRNVALGYREAKETELHLSESTEILSEQEGDELSKAREDKEKYREILEARFGIGDEGLWQKAFGDLNAVKYESQEDFDKAHGELTSFKNDLVDLAVNYCTEDKPTTDGVRSLYVNARSACKEWGKEIKMDEDEFIQQFTSESIDVEGEIAPSTPLSVEAEILEQPKKEKVEYDPGEVEDGADFYEMVKVKEEETGEESYYLYYGKEGKVHVDRVDREGTLMPGFSEIGREYLDNESGKDEMEKAIQARESAGFEVIRNLPLYKEWTKEQLQALDEKEGRIFKKEEKLDLPPFIERRYRKQEKQQVEPEEPEEPEVSEIGEKPEEPEEPEVPTTPPPEKPEEPEEEGEKEPDPLKGKLDELAKRRENLAEAIREFERAQKSAAGEETRTSTFGPSEKAKEGDYERLLGVAMGDYQNSLVDLNNYLHEQSGEIAEEERSEKYHLYENTIELLQINQGRLDAASDEERSGLEDERNKLTEIHDHFQVEISDELAKVALRGRFDNLGGKLYKLKTERIENSASDGQKIVLLKEFDMLLDERVGVFMEGKESSGDQEIKLEDTEEISLVYIEKDVKTGVKKGKKLRKDRVRKLGDTPSLGKGKGTRIERFETENGRINTDEKTTILLKYESEKPREVVHTWFNLRRAKVNVTKNAYSVEGEPNSIVMTDPSENNKQEVVDMARLDTMFFNSREDPNVVPEWFFSNKDSIIEQMIEDVEKAADAGYLIDPSAYVFRRDVATGKVEATVFDIENGVMVRQKRGEEGEDIVKEGVRRIRDRLALRLGIYNREEWNSKYPDHVLRGEDRPEPKDVRAGARQYEAVSIYDVVKEEWKDGLCWWGEDGNVYAEYGFYDELPDRRKSPRPRKINDGQVETREDVGKVIDEFLDEYKREHGSIEKGEDGAYDTIVVLRDISIPERFLSKRKIRYE